MSKIIDSLIDAGLIVFGGQVSNQPINRNTFQKRAEGAEQTPTDFWNAIEQIFGNLAVGREEDTIDRFITPIFEKLGFDKNIRLRNTGVREQRPDLIYFDTEENCEAGSSENSVAGIYCIVEAKPHYANLDQHQKQLRDYLDKYYARSENAIKWGILTNGYEWRLYRYGKTGYLGFKLKDIVTGTDIFTDEQARKNAARLFYNFFRREAFKDGAAFLNEIESAAQEAQERVKEELHKQAYPALLAIFNGYWRETQKNGNRPTRHEAYEDAIYFVYRLIFLLFSKGKELNFFENLPDEIKEIFGEKLRGAPVEVNAKEITFGPSNSEFSIHSSSFFESKLYDIFKWVNEGNPDLGVPQYNGGLFRKRRIDEERIDDYSIAVALKLLLFSPNGETLDYGNLDVQHLGNIYERLLLFDKPNLGETFNFCYKGKVGSGKNIELKFPEEWTYFDVDSAKRKNTGTYYTPDYIVQYIVAHTVGEKLSEIAKIENDKVVCLVEKPLAKILDLKILDPAMGSGHFLIRAIDYVANFIKEHIGKLEFHENGNITCGFGDITETVRDIYGEWDDSDKITDDFTGENNILFWSRIIAKRNIYGVDINPFAVELAKLAIWLHTFDEDEPLQFLDHHLKCGNSLIGFFDIGEIVLPGAERYRDFKQAVKDMAAIGKLRDTTIKEVHDSEELFEEARKRLMPYHYRSNAALAARHFMELGRSGAERNELINRIETLAYETGLSDEQAFKNPENNSEPESRSIFDPQTDIEPKKIPTSGEVKYLQEVFRIADKKRFFHWKLEFPEVWFRSDLRSGDPELENGGFDIVIGNPPYKQKEAFTPEEKACVLSFFPENSSNANIAAIFIKRSIQLAKNKGFHSFIVPKSLLFTKAWENDRNMIIPYLKRICDVSVAWDEVLLEQSMYSLKKSFECSSLKIDELIDEGQIENTGTIEKENISEFGIIPSRFDTNLMNIVLENKNRWLLLGDIAEMPCGLGYQRFLRSEGVQPVIGGNEIGRYLFKGIRGYFDQETVEKNSVQSLIEFIQGDYLNIQTIVAHVTKPIDHITLMATIGDNRSLPLNTITCLSVKEGLRYSSRFILTVFNSKFANWYSYPLVFSNAIRSMHFYEYFGSKLPIPRISFVTPEDERNAAVARLVEAYNANRLNADAIKAGADEFINPLLEKNFTPDPEKVAAHNADELNAEYQIPEGANWDRTDVLHDFLAHLAERMTDFARRKYILNEWDKGKVETGSVEEGEVLDILAEHDRELNHRDVRATRDEYAALFDNTDTLIDAIVYRLYGLTPEEIAIVEGYFERK